VLQRSRIDGVERRDQQEENMRDFFIGTFEKLVSVIVVLMGLGVVLGSFAAWADGGFLAFIAVLIGGAIYTILMGGFMYLGLGIYHNTQRTADALERQEGSRP
jgi:hypothetical protein